MNRADMRRYSIEHENASRACAGDDLLVRFIVGARAAIASFFSSGRVRLASACIGFLVFLLGTLGFAAGVDDGSISFVYVIPFLAVLIVASFVMLSRGERRSDDR